MVLPMPFRRDATMGLARRARPDQIERAESKRRAQRVGLHQEIAAIPRLTLDVDARHMEARALQAFGRAAGAAEQVERARLHAGFLSQPTVGGPSCPCSHTYQAKATAPPLASIALSPAAGSHTSPSNGSASGKASIALRGSH